MAETWRPPVAFHFRVDFLGISADALDARFQEVAGLSAELQTEEIVEGGENRYVHRVPARPKYPNLSLRRGLVASSALIRWVEDAIIHFSFKTATVNVNLLNEQHEALATYSFLGAYPLKWALSDLKAQESALAIESLELAYQYFRRIE